MATLWHFSIIKYKCNYVLLKFSIIRSGWSCGPTTCPPSSTPWLRQQPYSVRQPPHTCIPSWTSNPPTTPTASHSTVHYSQLPGLFIGPVSFPHLQGGRVVTVGPQSLSGILHGNENAPCWCRNLFLSLSPSRLARCYFVGDVRCSMWCKDNT